VCPAFLLADFSIKIFATKTRRHYDTKARRKPYIFEVLFFIAPLISIGGLAGDFWAHYTRCVAPAEVRRTSPQSCLGIAPLNTTACRGMVSVRAESVTRRCRPRWPPPVRRSRNEGRMEGEVVPNLKLLGGGLWCSDLCQETDGGPGAEDDVAG